MSVTITFQGDRVFLDGTEYPELEPRGSRPGMIDQLIKNKKAIMGSFGAVLTLVPIVLLAVPELGQRWPLAIKVVMALIGALATAAAHSSQPDVKPDTSPVALQPLSSPISPRIV